MKTHPLLWIHAILVISLAFSSTTTAGQFQTSPLAREYRAKAQAYSSRGYSNSNPRPPKLPPKSLHRQQYGRPQQPPPPEDEDESEETANDRIFAKPYKFPFWGLPFGVYSKGPEAFPTYDGSFGDVKGQGQAHGYPAVMGQGSPGAGGMLAYGAQVGGGYGQPSPPPVSNPYYPSYPAPSTTASPPPPPPPPPPPKKKIKIIKKKKPTTTPEPEEEEAYCECHYGQDCDCEEYPPPPAPPPPKYKKKKVYKKAPCKYGYMSGPKGGCKPPPATTTTEAPYEEEEEMEEEGEEYEHANPYGHYPMQPYPQMVPQYVPVPMYFGGMPSYPPHSYPGHPYYPPHTTPPHTYSSTTTPATTTTTTPRYETTTTPAPQYSTTKTPPTPGPTPPPQYPFAGAPQQFPYPIPGHMYPYPSVGYSPHQYYNPGPPYPYHFPMAGHPPDPTTGSPPQYPTAPPPPQYSTAAPPPQYSTAAPPPQYPTAGPPPQYPTAAPPPQYPTAAPPPQYSTAAPPPQYPTAGPPPQYPTAAPPPQYPTTAPPPQYQYPTAAPPPQYQYPTAGPPPSTSQYAIPEPKPTPMSTTQPPPTYPTDHIVAVPSQQQTLTLKYSPPARPQKMYRKYPLPPSPAHHEQVMIKYGHSSSTIQKPLRLQYSLSPHSSSSPWNPTKEIHRNESPKESITTFHPPSSSHDHPLPALQPLEIAYSKAPSSSPQVSTNLIQTNLNQLQSQQTPIYLSYSKHTDIKPSSSPSHSFGPRSYTYSDESLLGKNGKPAHSPETPKPTQSPGTSTPTPNCSKQNNTDASGDIANSLNYFTETFYKRSSEAPVEISTLSYATLPYENYEEPPYEYYYDDPQEASVIVTLDS